MTNFELFATALGIFSIVKGVLAHVAYSQFAKELKGDFTHYAWDRENPPLRNETWSTRSTPMWVIESRKNWDKTKIKRDLAEGRRDFYFVSGLICFGIFLNALRTL